MHKYHVTVRLLITISCTVLAGAALYFLLMYGLK